MSEQNEFTVESFVKSVALDPSTSQPEAIVSEDLKTVKEGDENQRFVASLAALFMNQPSGDTDPFDKQHIQELIDWINTLVQDQLNEILHNEDFQSLESTWRGIEDLVTHTNFKANIGISLLDASKDKLREDLELNSADIAGSELYKKLYVAEYDQYGGSPFGGMVGLYSFANTPDDRTWLRTAGKIAVAAHAPFIAAVAPKFFGVDKMSDLNELRDIEGMLETPKYAAWQAMRDSEEAAYIGLTLPRYMVRAPYNPETNPTQTVHFEEKVDDESDYLWANSAILFARNLVRSFENSGWCQNIRGPKGGGAIKDLSAYEYEVRGESVLKLPVEISIPDFREFELANAGFIPLVQKKDSAEAVFFSAQSIKMSHKFKDPKDSENSQLVTNMSYTYSITRIAHYLKCIMRDNIGSTAHAQYIHNQIDSWVSRYVTALVNPDDLTLRYYPFKAYSLKVEEVPGRLGWYKCDLSILPHVQFEGMDVDLRIDARLG